MCRFLKASKPVVHAVHHYSSPKSLSFSQIEEVPGEMTQDDLATDDVMILDTWEQVKTPELRYL